jgi:Family of unknown function (DUF5757)
METLYIDGKKIDFSFLDTPQTVENKFSLLINSLPEYIKFENIKLEQDEKIRVEMLQDRINDLSFDEFLENIDSFTNWNELFPIDKISLLSFYLSLNDDQTPGMRKIDILSDEQIKKIQEINPSLFSVPNIQAEIEKFEKETENKKKQLASVVKKFTQLSKNLSLLDSVPTSNFIIQDSNFETVIDIAQPLLTLFDNCILSEKIPFLYVKFGKYTFFKVWKNIKLSKEIIDSIFSDTKKIIEGLFFPIIVDPNNWFSCFLFVTQKKLEVKKESDSSKKTMHKLSKQELTTEISDFLQTEIKLEETAVKGDFTVTVKNYNKIIFLDLITNNAIFSYFTFLYELEKIASEKSRLSFYFNSIGEMKNRSNSIYITLTEIPNTGKLLVRVSRTKSLAEVNSFIKIFEKLLSLYSKEYNSVFKEYERIFSSEELKTITVEKEQEQTQQKSKNLQDRKPDLFLIKEYVRKCQKEKQPYIIDNVQEYTKQFGEGKILQYFDTFYGCEPRDPTRPKDIDYVYPGLQINSQTNSDIYPYVPCCFKTDQYIKKGSQLNKYIGKEQETKGTAYIVGERKIVSDKQNGELPFFIKNSLLNLGYSDIQRGKKTIFPFLRHGVPQNKNSILYCLELAKDPGFEKQDRDAIVEETRQNLTKQPLNFTRQSTFGYTDQELRQMLETDFIDSKLFICLLEQVYQINIFIFSICDTENIEIPRHEGIFIPGRKQFDDSVVLFRYGKFYNIMFDIENNTYILNEEISKTVHKMYKYLTKFYCV